MKQSSKVRVGICGFGASATHFHLPLMEDNARFEPIAVYDPTAKRGEMAKEFGFKYVFNPEDLSASIYELGLDLVIVTSPSCFHYEQTKAALNAGAHVLVDKPLALCIREVNSLIKLAARKNSVLMAFHNRAYDRDHLKALSLVEGGELGKLIRIDMSISSWGPSNQYAVSEFRPSWRSEKKYGGGGLNDWGPHILDQLLRFTQWELPKRVIAISKASVWTDDCDDLLIAILDWGSFCARLLISAVDMHPLERLRICGSAGTLTVRGSDKDGEIRTYTQNKSQTYKYSNTPLSAAPLYSTLLQAITTGSGTGRAALLGNTRKAYLLLEKIRLSLESVTGRGKQ